MVVIRILSATAFIPFLNAIIVDSYYTPTQNKEQIQPFQPIKPNGRPAAENPNRETYHSKEVSSDSYVKPLYKYGYSVLDPYTLDVKSHWEHRDGDFVKGAYNMLEADGSMRIVEYVSDKGTGFRAVVKKIPHYLKNERPGDAFPLQKSNNYPEQFSSQPKPAAPPPSYQQGHDKGHLQSLHDNPIRVYDDRPFIPVRQYEDRPFSPVRQFDDRPSGQIRQHDDRPFSPVRQFDDRPSGQIRQYDDRPFSPVRQFDDRPSSQIRQYDDRPFSPVKQFDERPSSQIRQYDDRPFSPVRQFDDRPSSPILQYDDRPSFNPRQLEDRPLNENYVQRDNYYKSYQKKAKKQQPVLKARPLISTG